KRIRVNCDLHHVDVVLCCDPKAFLHTNPLEGLNPGGAFVWESDESPATAWERIPPRYRQRILDEKIRVYILPGFAIARAATDRGDLQLRMQGNAFLGAFFGVSSFLADNGIDREHYAEVVRAQYVKKFGRFGEAVVESNMEVMEEGFTRVAEIAYGAADAPDRSNMRGQLLVSCAADSRGGLTPPAPGQGERAPLFTLGAFDREFRAGLGYDQPASPFAAVGIMAAATGATASKTVARRETPIWIPENCTQCMECIAACPDTALPNTAQDLATVLRTAIVNYVSDPVARAALLKAVPALDAALHARMLAAAQAKEKRPVPALLAEELAGLADLSAAAKAQLLAVMEQVPLAYGKVNAIFLTKEKKEAGSGGVFSIFVSDLCKGCAECVTECGDHEALVMAPETEELNSHHLTGTAFMNLLPDTPRKYLGLYDDEHPQGSKTAALRNHLMQRRNYQALVSGDGACAGCGEKSVLHAVASLTEALMRPVYHAKAERLAAKAARLRAHGEERLAALAAGDPEGGRRWRQAVAELLMGLGGESEEDSLARLAGLPDFPDAVLVDAVARVLEQDAFNHKDLQALDGRLASGMSVMAMGAHTGCNTVYGSTPPNNPHPYPWMNSLFQDGATVAWLFGESFIMDHARRSVIPERLADMLLGDGRGESGAGRLPSAAERFALAHLTDADMSEREVSELPKAWAIGGDGGMGDIGFQNVSKVLLQNRPNVKLLMLDTQVYSNTGGQNSDSSPSPGGFDMNQFGEATQGKAVEKKSLAEIFTAGHGSPYVAQVSLANAPRLYQAILDALAYRGTAFLQCFTTCQPEHGVADDMATQQAQRIRDSRGMPEFVFDPRGGESYAEALDLKGNPAPEADWWEARSKDKQTRYRYTVAHWAASEARFRRHFKRLKPGEAAGLVPLESMLLRISQQDVVARRYRDRQHRSFVPDFGVFIRAEDESGAWQELALSRQMVLFCVERRKAWRMLQSKAGIVNREYRAQKALLAKLDAGELTLAELDTRGEALLAEAIAGLEAR
ncbi:oxidoreductase, partial [bacterium]|nr:oxidoreductase [bacterium]